MSQSVLNSVLPVITIYRRRENILSPRVDLKHNALYPLLKERPDSNRYVKDTYGVEIEETNTESKIRLGLKRALNMDLRNFSVIHQTIRRQSFWTTEVMQQKIVSLKDL